MAALHPSTASLAAVDPQAVLEARARHLAQTPAEKTAGAETLELAAFHLGLEYLGLPTFAVYEVQPLRAHHWTRVPCTPAFIVGAINLRGHIYAIMDLARFWGLPPRPMSEKAHVLLVRGRDGGGQELELTFLADDRPQVCQVPLASLAPPPATVSAHAQAFLRGVAPDMLMVLDIERLLSHPGLIVQDEV